MTMFVAGAAYNITYAPYVSDHSRYLPRRTRSFPIVAAVFLGTSSSAIWLTAIGAWRGLLSYGVGLVAMVPFAVLPAYPACTGVIAGLLGGVDHSVVVGLVVSGGLNPVLCRSPALAAEQPAIEAGEWFLAGGAR